MRLGWALAIVVGGVASACSLVTSLNGFSSGESAHVGDGGDASPPGPDVAEGRDDGSTSTLSWCATHAPDAGFCEDFDERGIDLFDRKVTDNGEVRVDTTVSRSAPASLRASAGPGRAEVAAFVAKAGAPNPTRARVAFDLRIDTAHPSSSAELVHLELGGDSRWYDVGLGVTEGGQAVYAYEFSANPSIYNEHMMSKAIPLATWVRMTMTADLAAKTVTIEREDDPAAPTAPIVVPFTGPLQLELGIAYARTGQSGWSVLMDNVVFDWN